MTMPAKAMPRPALAAGEREAFREGEAVGVVVAVVFVVREVGAGVWVVMAKVRDDGPAERE
jgi:hypothetical protein